MNLPYTYQLLFAADQQRHGFIKLRGAQADHEVRLMAEAHLVEASFGDGKEGSFTSINRVTKTGRTFLRAFEHHPIPAEEALAESSHAALAKWKVNLDFGSVPLRKAAWQFRPLGIRATVAHFFVNQVTRSEGQSAHAFSG
ncbi:MAG: hypothetical protein QOC70_1522 [Verrucomicrobiota bacterium]|jgi:hypothetical protein